MSAQPVDIQIFGRSLRVNCPPDQRDALNQAADDLNQRLQDLKERTRVTNTEQLVFIAALNISYELAQEKAKTRDYAASMEPVSYTHLTLPTTSIECRSRWSPYH